MDITLKNAGILDVHDEGFLKNIAGVLLVTGIISALFIFVTTSYITVGAKGYLFGSTSAVDWNGVFTSIIILGGSVITWALLRVVANISISLKQKRLERTQLRQAV